MASSTRRDRAHPCWLAGSPSCSISQVSGGKSSRGAVCPIRGSVRMETTPGAEGQQPRSRRGGAVPVDGRAGSRYEADSMAARRHRGGGEGRRRRRCRRAGARAVRCRRRGRARHRDRCLSRGDLAAAGAVAAAGLVNVTIRPGRADRTGLPVESCDVDVRHVLAHNGGGDVIVAHLAMLLRPGGCLYGRCRRPRCGCARGCRADGPAAARPLPSTARGYDVLAGLRLGERLGRAGLELVDFRGTYVIGPVPPARGSHPGLRETRWAAAGLATQQDVARWVWAFDRFDAAYRPTLFSPHVHRGRPPSSLSAARPVRIGLRSGPAPAAKP